MTILAGSVVVEAYRLIGVVAEDEDPTPTQMARGLKTLGSMLRTWQVDQAMDWLRTDAWMGLHPGRHVYVMGGNGTGAAYDFPVRPLELLDASISDYGTDIEIEVVTGDDYHHIPEKALPGRPLKAYLDPQLGQALLYVWPVPDRAYTMKFAFQREISIPTAEADVIEAPDEFEETLEYTLATRLAPRNGVPAQAYLNRPGFAGEFFVQNLGDVIKSIYARVEGFLHFLRRPIANSAM